MNKDQYSKEAYEDFEKFWGLFIESAKAQRPDLPEEELKEWEVGIKEYFALRNEMVLHLSEQRELELK
jgi:hypothetical protein